MALELARRAACAPAPVKELLYVRSDAYRAAAKMSPRGAEILFRLLSLQSNVAPSSYSGLIWRIAA